VSKLEIAASLTMESTERPKTQLILAGSLACAMVLTLGVLSYVMYKKQPAMKQVLRSLLSFEGFLMLELCFEVWVCSPLSCFQLSLDN
jgi:hypothetical protein